MAGFNLSERYILIINLLIGVVLIPYFLALCIGDGVKLHFAGDILPSQTDYARAAGPTRIAGPRPRAAYDVITRRDIFSLAPPPEVAAPVVNENLDIKLVGTSQLSSGNPYAIVEDPSGNQILYRLGNTIPNAGPLVEVTRNRIVVLHNGHRVAVEIPRDDLQAAPPFAPQPGFAPSSRFNPGMRHGFRRGPMGRHSPTLGPGVRKLAPNRYLLTRATVNSNLNNMSPLFTQIRAVPNIENGASNGFRLSEIQPNSIFQQIGLQNGDLLTSVNGQPVGNPAKAMALMQTLQSQSSITLNVVRNGAPTQLFYFIR
jgi:type II secretion system protein C